MSSGEESSYSVSTPVKRRPGRPRKYPLPVAQVAQVASDPSVRPVTVFEPEQYPSPMVLPPAPSPEPDHDEFVVLSVRPLAEAAAAAAETFRCPHCKQMLGAGSFAIKNEKRCKVCRSCQTIAREHYHSKKERANAIDWSALEVRRHPVYTQYGADEQGQVFNLKSHKIIGAVDHSGYINVGLYVPHLVIMRAHRFVFECYNGLITDQTMVVMHIDNNKRHNAPANLTLGTQSQNVTDAWRDGLHEHTRIGKRAIIAKNLETGVEQRFPSMTSAGRLLNIKASPIKMVCDGITDSARDMSTGMRYSFRYAHDAVAAAPAEAPASPAEEAHV